MQQHRSRRRPFVVATGLLSLEATAFSPASRIIPLHPNLITRGVAHNLAAVQSSAAPLSASEATHRPLHEESLPGARELSSLNGKYGGLYSSETMLESASKEFSSEGVLGFQIDDFDTPLGDTIDIEQNERGKIKINISGVGRRPSISGVRKSDLAVEEEVPPWLPEIPTKAQILCLNVRELKGALGQRGLRKKGRKAELQRRLMMWAAKKDGERVKSRLVGLKELLGSAVSQERRATVISNPGIKRDLRNTEQRYDVVDALTNRRKAINKRNSRGTLGLVDESFFDDTDELTEDEDDTAANNIQINQELRDQVSRAFEIPSKLNNRELREMYIKAKFADQNGDRSKAKYILHQLRVVSPNDMRIVRRLARMEMEDGNISASRKLLQAGVREFPEDAHLIHGLGQLERTCGNDSLARQYFQSATETNPTFPNPYHALGTLEHSHGNIKMALAVIKKGIQNCPDNHRLHHALGDVYLDAQMLDLAEDSYLTALKHVGHEWGRSFVYNSLSYVAYAKHDIDKCRSLLRQSLDINDMHAQGVIALAQLEESEGNFNDARKIYRDAITNYEQKRLGRSSISLHKSSDDSASASHFSPSYPGDKWINVFRSWARMEEMHGNYESTHIVFSRAIRLFPDSSVLMTEWARLQVENDEIQKGKLLFEAACQRANGSSTEPYRLFAEFEMRCQNFEEAQSILFRGAQAVAESSDGGTDCNTALAYLFHSWGVCEHHLGNADRAEQLFNDAIRVTGSGESDANIRSLILYSMARLEFEREEFLLAQHCVGLSLKENLLPGGNSQIWLLWAAIAKKMGNDKLKSRCLEQASLRKEEEKGGMASDISRILEERASASDASNVRMGSAMKNMFRRTPWCGKICITGRMDKPWYDGARLWAL